MGPIVEAGALEIAIAKFESQGHDQMQRCIGSRACASDVSGIWWNFWIDKDDLGHEINQTTVKRTEYIKIALLGRCLLRGCGCYVRAMAG